MSFHLSFTPAGNLTIPLLSLDISSLLHSYIFLVSSYLLFSSSFLKASLSCSAFLTLPIAISSNYSTASFPTLYVFNFAIISSRSSVFFIFLTNSSQKYLSNLDPGILVAHKVLNSLMTSFLLFYKFSFSSFTFLSSSAILSISTYLIYSCSLILSSISFLALSFISFTSCFFLYFSISSSSLYFLILGSLL